MATWTCSTCSRLNPVTAARCMACGATPATEPTVMRTGPMPVVAPPASLGTTEEPLPPEDPSFPWAIVGAAAVALVLVAAVVGVVIARSSSNDEAQVKTTAMVPSTTTAPVTTTRPAPSSTTTLPPTTTTLPPKPTTTLPPKPVGVACPSSMASDGTVFTRDLGGRVLFRPAARKAAREVDSTTDSATIAYWADAGNASFEEESFTTWIKARLPRNADSCGYVTAANVHMPIDTFGVVMDEYDECTTYEAVTAAVNVCQPPDGDPIYSIVWKAQRAASREVGTAIADGAGWKAEDAGARLLFTVDNSTIKITRNGQQLFIDDVLEFG